jgi:4-amino-4-deoxy-L-arabinose transferase-like glycosyltransferase
VLLILIGGAFCLRLYEIAAPALDFQPTRQYRSALIARAFYLEGLEDAPQWEKLVARANAEMEGVLEPPILEYVAASLYHLAGGEHLWIPRVLSSIFWLTGGMCVYLIGIRIASKDAGLISLAFYLFLPFAVAASRSFQPDPLMIMLLLFTILAILRYHDSTSWRTLIVTGIVSGLAVFVKPVCLFPILASFLALAINRQGAKGLISPQTSLFVLLSFLAASLFYFNGIFITGSLRAQAQSSFLPKMILEPYFWKFWLKHIYAVTGFIPFIGGLVGVFLLRQGWQRALLAGLWLGYFAFGLSFTYHIHTHNYYQLQLVPIVALSVGPVCSSILTLLIEANRHRHLYFQAGAYCLLFLSVILSAGLYIRSREELPEFDSQVRLAREIGEIIAHSKATVFLDFNGQALRYYGGFSGAYWPDQGEQRAAQLWGEPDLTVLQRFEAMSRNKAPEYFIVTNLVELEAQGELNEYLRENFVVLAENAQYVIFDLRASNQ